MSLSIVVVDEEALIVAGHEVDHQVIKTSVCIIRIIGM